MSASGSWGQTIQGRERGRGVGHECKWELGPDHTREREREGVALAASASGSWGQTIQGGERGSYSLICCSFWQSHL